MQTASEMFDFIQGKRPERLAASPLFTNVMVQQLHGHRWLGSSCDSRVIEDIAAVGRTCGFVPFFEVLGVEIGMLDYDTHEVEERENLHRVNVIRTPQGDNTLVDTFEPFHSRQISHYPFSSPADLDAYDYFIRRSIDRIDQCRPVLKRVVEEAGQRAIPYFIASAPHRCFSLFAANDLILLFMDEPERMDQICALNASLSMVAAKVANECGIKIIFEGTEGTLYSPPLLRRYALPYMLALRKQVCSLGGLYYLHECGRMAALRDDGFYADLAPDILEGFQAPPSGDVNDLPAFMDTLPESVVSKGNLDLNFLLNRSAFEVKAEGIALLHRLDVRRRHILGGSCSALPGTPLDNLAALVEAVRTVNAESIRSGSQGD